MSVTCHTQPNVIGYWVVITKADFYSHDPLITVLVI